MLRHLLVGACLGAIGAALVWQFYPGFWKEPPVAPQDVALQNRLALQQEAQHGVARAELAAVVRPPTAASTCDLEPLIPPNGAHDGQASTEHPFPAGPRARAKVFLRAAEVATTQGRLRDAEVALLAACRWSEEASTRPTVPLARVLATLGESYVAAARREASFELRGQLVTRARQLLGVSAQTYASALGPNAAKSRDARARLAELDGAEAAVEEEVAATIHGEAHAAEAAPPARAAAVRPAPVAKAAPALQPGASVRTVDEPAVLAVRPEPARAVSDPEIRQLASDLTRLRAQAESMSEDPEAFRRRAEAARAQRERCQDAACLREWYSTRRKQLLAEF